MLICVIIAVEVILAVAVAWLVCGILTATDAIPNDVNHWAYRSRTDTKSYVSGRLAVDTTTPTMSVVAYVPYYRV